MARRTGLGKRGLDILIPDKGSGKSENKKPEKAKTRPEKKKNSPVKTTAEEENFQETVEDTAEDVAEEENHSGQLTVDINTVEPNRDQPRKQFNEDSLQELADSIKLHGIIEPLIVQKRDDYYEIVAGERRWRAAKIAGLKEIPVIVRDYSDREIMELSLIENIQRQDLNPIEEAAAFKRLIEDYSLTQDQVAERVSKSRAAITNALRLLRLDARVQNMLVGEMLSTGHVRALLAIEDGELQFQTAQKAFDEKMSVREVESYVRKLLKKPAEPKPPAISQQLQTIYHDMEERMKTSLRTKVSIQSKTPEKGRVEIEYFSSDELERIYQAILNGEER